MNIYSPIKPTYLYIKQHSITGLKYFGKTTKDPRTYLGSGIKWKSHIKKHGKQFVKTLWISDLYYDTSIKEIALHFSTENNIVESDKWANLIQENGLDSGTLTKNQKIKISQKQKYNWNKNNSPYNEDRNLKCSNIKKEQWEDLKSKYNSNTYRLQQKKLKEKQYEVINPIGTKFIITGLKQFCKENNLSEQNMYKVSNKLREHHKGWKCNKII
jgi:hypothetical protein